ncbi:inositol oxygenase-like [Amphibalanus amphitrite]|uniref:inositol oxygenase-like n=1 Tax=Amphibalanus amphitrite TaxID=1232801 RepID=UPI001C91A976|nr:inositol oxygenase-like [Amphibalanus amphitrite]
METRGPVCIIDPSELYRPEVKAKKAKGLFREYSIDKTDHIQTRVRDTYLKMHTYQTVDYVKQKIAYWTRFDKFEADIMPALEKLNDLVDESDPDVDVPNIVHAFQTAERIRADYPDLDWFHLTGLIHDLGKVLAFYGEPQYSTVGDTFVVGCRVGSSVVYRDSTFHDNPDVSDPRYSTENGIYEPGCGLDKVLMSWGHDEYLYRVLKHNKCTLPDEGLAMIRFHSFYPWHTGGDYMHLCNDKDLKMLPWIRTFNKYDLYTKSDHLPDIPALMPYYQSLIDKYCPGKLQW